tara:strand:+ start:2054 stop:3289 length:1236 start_codon:yes stop_codon:yes gene_type:complete
VFSSKLWTPISGGITAPNGFRASGIRANLKESGKPDLALLVAPEGAICSGTFTQSVIRASCIDICRQRLKNNFGRARAVVINSGQANACTGKRGLEDSLRITNTLAGLLNLKDEEILISSTGVIGEPIPMTSLLNGLDSLVNELSLNGGPKAASAILTTDLVDKQIAFEALLGDQLVRIGGMAKGSGMIHPDMATMLGFFSCDTSLPQDVWSAMLVKAIDLSFNSITVDGDTSTNDSCIAFAAGDPLDVDYFEALQEGLVITSQHLAKMIARDGEGANCLIEVQVEGTEQSEDSRYIARHICASSLVKTAIHGCDPNWGRILAALGNTGISFNPEEICLWIGPYQLIQAGEPIHFHREDVSKYIRQKLQGEYLIDDSVVIRLSIGNGSGKGFAWGCDLSDQYVRINADYTT